MSGGSQFSAEVPKGDAWGVEQAVHAAALALEHDGRSPMIPCIAVITVKSVKLMPGDDGPTRVAVVKVARIEALNNPTAIRNGQKLILRALQERKGGEGVQMLPFEEREILEMAFGGISADEIEQDEREAIEDENMDDPQRLRRHLVAVHGLTAEEAEGMEWVDVRKKHQDDHELPESEGMPVHDPEWWAWRRVDLEAAEADADGTTSDDPDGGPDDAADDDTADEDEDDGGGAPAAVFQEPAADGDQGA